MRYPRARLAVLAALSLSLGTTACASNRSASGSDRGQADVITEEELEDWADQDLYRVIQRIRPAWLHNRATYTGIGRASIALIVDGRRGVLLHSGSLTIRADNVREVRYLNASDAATRFGLNMTAGAIIVTTKH